MTDTDKKLREVIVAMDTAISEAIALIPRETWEAYPGRTALLERASSGLAFLATPAPPERPDAVAECIRDIRGDTTDRELIDRLVEVQGYLRHGGAAPPEREGRLKRAEALLKRLDEWAGKDIIYSERLHGIVADARAFLSESARPVGSPSVRHCAGCMDHPLCEATVQPVEQ